MGRFCIVTWCSLFGFQISGWLPILCDVFDSLLLEHCVGGIIFKYEVENTNSFINTQLHVYKPSAYYAVYELLW